MKTKQLNHSKVKNVGILFELLVRQNAVDIMEGKKEAPSAVLMKKYFNPSTEMGKELQLYRSFFEIGKLTESKAIQMIDLVASQRKKLNEGKLSDEKYQFIKEVKDYYDLNEFLKVKVPSYKIYASIFKAFLSETSDFTYSNIQDVARSRFTLVEHLVSDHKKNDPKKNSIFELLKNESEDIRMLTLKLMVERYNERYKDMNSRQKNLLKEYISYSDPKSFLKFVQTESQSLSREIYKLSNLQKNKVLGIKLQEVSKSLKSYEKKTKINDHDLTCMMIGYQLVEELQ